MTACVANISDFWMYSNTPALTQQDHNSYIHLFAQDRIEEGLAHFDKIDRKESWKNYNMIILQ